ncbi:hypothetical protein K2X89_06925 [Myxococcota bacterium]|nr:hypothetical protein [Myxococcota bacterium]
MKSQSEPEDRDLHRSTVLHALLAKLALLALPAWLLIATPASAPAQTASHVLDPSARLVTGDHASEYWTLFVELDSGHRITQRFLITNLGPGDHSAVAVGHLMERGRPPYRYVNGRRRSAWTLSPDRLFLDIASSHLDLHRPKGALKITKDDIEINLRFDLGATTVADRVPANQLPSRYFVEVLAVGATTDGSLRAPWMTAPVPVTGRTWLVHTWTPDDEADLIRRRVDLFGRSGAAVFYGLQVTGDGPFTGSWQILSRPIAGKARPPIRFGARWKDGVRLLSGRASSGFPVPDRFDWTGTGNSGSIHLSNEWLRFDPFEVIPQPFRWFVRMSSQPQEVWADSRIAVSIGRALGSPSPTTSTTERVSNSTRESEDETAELSVTGVASITFMNPIDRH